MINKGIKRDRLLFEECDRKIFYNSVSACSRCGNCQQSCEIYHLNKREEFSPRGYNQFIKLMIEKKIPSTKGLKREYAKFLGVCTLCGKCSQFCAVRVPTAQHVLNARRLIGLKNLPFLLNFVLCLRENQSRIFPLVMKMGIWLRRIGLIEILSFCGILKWKSLSWMQYLHQVLPKEINYLPTKLKEKTHYSLLFLPSLEAQWFGKDYIEEILSLTYESNVYILRDVSCGLFSFLYGDVRLARKKVISLIKYCKSFQKGDTTILTDSIDIYLFLKHSPELFLEYPFWQKRAENFAKKLVFLTDFIKNSSEVARISLPIKLERASVLFKDAKPFLDMAKILRRQFNENFIDYEYGQASFPTGGYGCLRGNQLEAIATNVIKFVAGKQIRTICSLSIMATFELNFWLKRFYPSAKAQYVSKLYLRSQNYDKTDRLF